MADTSPRRTDLKVTMTVDGEPFDANLMEYVKSIKVKLTQNYMSELSLSIFSPLVKNNNATKWVFSKGRTLVIYAGWKRDTYLGAGVIDRQELQTDSQTLNITCPDLGCKMGKKEDNTPFTGRKDSEIVKAIAKKYQVSVEADDSEFGVERVQSNQTDYEFMRELATKNKFQLYFDYDPEKKLWVMKFKKPVPVKQKTVYEYDYSDPEGGCSNFQPQTYGEVSLKGKLRMHCWIAEAKQDLVLEEKTVGEDTVEEIFDKRFQVRPEAQAYLQRLAKTRNDNYMTASARVLGNNDLKVNEIIVFKGLNFKFFPSLDGDYRINEIEHEIEGTVSFYTNLQLSKVN